MSLWGATVITNLMSAIPWVGQDIVESTIVTMFIIYLIIILFSSYLLPTIGVVNNNALKKKKKVRKLYGQINKVISLFLQSS